MHKAKKATNMLKSFHNTLTTVKPVLVATSVKQATCIKFSKQAYSVKFQWLEHLWDHET